MPDLTNMTETKICPSCLIELADQARDRGNTFCGAWCEHNQTAAIFAFKRGELEELLNLHCPSPSL